jgi:glycerol-3-phosphate cytidylyltransferase-like family protein
MRIVSAHGGFDPLHPGHIDYLEGSYMYVGLDDKFIVILTRDDQLEEKNRQLGYPKKRSPIPYEARRKVLEWGLKGRGVIVPNVDKGITICESLAYYRPSIMTQGGDRRPGNIVEEEVRICEEIGCKVIYGVGGYGKKYSSRNM